MDNVLKNIMIQYCDDFNHVFRDKDLAKYIVKNSIPIIWFGDLEKYKASPVKIVTVGLNPSWHEFWEKKGMPLSTPRFDHVTLSSLDDEVILSLYDTFNHYFVREPFWGYFKQYENLLRGIGASFYQTDSESIALHVDAYTPIATDPFFGELSSDIQWQFKARGMVLYKKLINFLCPDVILISVAREDFYAIHPNVQAVDAYADPNKKGVYIHKYHSTEQGSNQQIILGRNYNGTPFGGRTIDETIQILQRMLQTG